MTAQERTRRLMLLHRYNACVLTFLVLSGLLLYAPGLRGALAPVRVPLKDVHIAAGLLQLGLLLAYLPLLGGHWQRLTRRYGQQINVVLLVALVGTWSLSGSVIWLHRWLPERWAALALPVHDWATWLAIPWSGLHAITRYWRWRFPLPGWWIGYSHARAFDPAEFARPMREYEPKWRTPVTRRVVVQALGTAAGTLALYGLWRFLGGSTLGGSLGEDPGYRPEAAVKPPARAAASGAAPPAGPTPRPTKGPLDLDQFAPGDNPELDTATAQLGTRAPEQPLLVDADLPVPSSATPAGGGRDGRFRLYTVTDDIPAFKPDQWRFEVTGLVDRHLTFSWRQFINLPRTVMVKDFHCVTGWTVAHVSWEGVKLSELLRRAGVRPEGRFVKFYSADGIYTDALPLDFARQDDILVPFLIDNTPIPVPMGGPARLVVPKMYGYKSVKWLTKIEVIPENHEGFWEVRGYPNDALLPEYGGKFDA